MKNKHDFRPSYKVFLGATFAVALLVFTGLKMLMPAKVTSASETNPLINIDELSEAFMDEYLSSYAEMASHDNKENILIVTSGEPLEKTFGAKNIVAAANNQYFLEYDSSEERDFAFEQIDRDPNLAVAQNLVRTLFDEDDETDGYNSWGIEKMGLGHAKELVENYSQRNEVTVAIIDTGLDVELFEENYPEEKLAGVYNVLSHDETMSDEVGHGTHIAGTIAEGTPSNVKILPVKISDSRALYSTDIIAGVNYITYYEKADVINMSFGGYTYQEAEYLAMEAAKEKNIINVAAAGNEATSSRSFPCSFDNTISISAVDSELHLAEFSNFGSTVDFAAPGVNILSINGNMSGTSMATPHAVAAVAIAKSFRKELSMDETIDFLKTRSIDLGIKGKDSRFGYGFVDFSDAILCSSVSQLCDEFGIFEQEVEVGIEIVQPNLTPYNYGSLTNILATELKINNASGSYKSKPLGDFGTDIEIDGYDPYATGGQTVTVKYGEFTTSFVVENPEDWENGWDYNIEHIYQQDDVARLVEYRDHGLDIKTLYLPETIDGYAVAGTYSGCMFSSDASWCTYPDSEDAKYYETLVIPASMEQIGGFSGNPKTGKLQSLQQIIILGDVVEVSSTGFAYLKNLVRVEGAVTMPEWSYVDMDGNHYKKYDGQAFADDESLTEVTLAEGLKAIPHGTFYGCKSLETIQIPDSVTTIEEQAFFGAGIKSLTLGDNIEKIEKDAFAKSDLEEIFIPASATEISDSAFGRTTNLRSIVVDENNPVYDSREGSNAIILTEENKLIAGAYTTMIPSSVKIIGKNSFDSMERLSEIVIPEGVETIEAEAFAWTYYLQKVVLPKTLVEIDETAFLHAGMATPSKTVFWIWDSTYAQERVFEMDCPYILLDEITEEPAMIADATFEVMPEDRSFSAQDTFSPENFLIKIFYLDEETRKPAEESELITDYHVIYNSGSSEALIGGSNLVSFVFDTAAGYHNIKIDMNIGVRYLIPEYEIPTGITAYSGQALSEVELPEEFSWMDEDEFVDEAKTEYLARFTPTDARNYKTIDDIAVPVAVKVGTTFTEIFPDENLQACILGHYFAGDTAETVNLEEVLGLTELSCAESEIKNMRGVERMTELETLKLADNEIEKINLTKNTKLESLDIRGNRLTKLDITKNLHLNEFLADETKLENEQLIVKTAAYLEQLYDEDTRTASSVVMNISGLDFLRNADFSIIGADATYDAETGIITFAKGGLRQMRVSVELEDGETIYYTIYGFPRDFYFTIYLDGELYDEKNNMFYTYTGFRYTIKGLAEDISTWLQLSGYALEDGMVEDLADELAVGTSDAYVTLWYRNTRRPIEPDEPGEPGNPDEPEEDSEDIEPSQEFYPKEDVKTPNTGYSAKAEKAQISEDAVLGESWWGMALIVVSVPLVMIVATEMKKTERQA